MYFTSHRRVSAQAYGIQELRPPSLLLSLFTFFMPDNRCSPTEAWKYNLWLLVWQHIHLLCWDPVCSVCPALRFLLRLSVDTGLVESHRSERTMGTSGVKLPRRGALSRLVYLCLNGAHFSFLYNRGKWWTQWHPSHLPLCVSPPFFLWPPCRLLSTWIIITSPPCHQ